ncbi:MAG: 1-(5-phosphoribosyl)-5-[(5-phosphoribosylamino)methylideneamino]imidazole-4-carboxamide isomerase [Anaerolineae bacterium]
MIIFPAIDLRQGRCVRLVQGRIEDETVYSDDPLAVAQRWVAEGAQWLHVVNLDGAFGATARQNLEVVQRIAETVEVPIQFGGGLRDFEAIETAFDLGVVRVVLGTAAVKDPRLVELAIAKFGSEGIVLGIDARGGRVATHGWQQVSDVDAVDLALEMLVRGIRRVVYTDIARDGTLAGPNMAAIAEMARRTGLYVIASGGISSLDDIRQLKALEPLGVEGVIVGKALYTGRVNLSQAIEVARSEEPC